MSGYEDKDTEIFGTNSLYNREVHIRAQKKTEKSSRIIWKLSRKALIFAPASREKHCFGAKENGSEKFWKKFQNLLEIRKFDLPLHPLRIRQNVWGDAKKGSEKILKNLSKRFGGSKNNTYLCTTFPPRKTVAEPRGKPKGQPQRIRKKLFFIEI